MIDQLDQELTIELQKDGRRSDVGLAELLHISEVTARNRVRQLPDTEGVKATVVPDLQTALILGYSLSIIGRMADRQTAPACVAWSRR